MSCGSVGGTPPKVIPTTGAVAGASGGRPATSAHATAAAATVHDMPHVAPGGAMDMAKCLKEANGGGGSTPATADGKEGAAKLGGPAGSDAMLEQINVLMKSLQVLIDGMKAHKAGAVAGANGGPTTGSAPVQQGGPVQVADQLAALQVATTNAMAAADTAVLGASGEGEGEAVEAGGEVDQSLPPGTMPQSPSSAGTGSAPMGGGGTSVSSPAGQHFSERATSSLATVGGIGTSELVHAWNEVPAAERATLRSELAPQLAERMDKLAATVRGWGSGQPNDNDLGRLRLEQDSVGDLERTLGLGRSNLAPDAVAKVRGVIEARVSAFEREAAATVSSARASGTPNHAAAQDMGERVARLQNIFGVIDDPALKARLDKVPVTMVGAVLLNQ